jgi:hypothetical protein
MPPRRSARVAAAAAELCTSALSPLPLALAQRIFVSLPVDSRARACCVCRAWRDSLADPALWTHLVVMRGEPPWALLRCRNALLVDFAYAVEAPGGLERVAPFAAALADAALQPELSGVTIWRADTQRPEVLDALVDAALARRVRELSFMGCSPPAPAPLARLLAGGALAAVLIAGEPGDGVPLLDAAGAALVAASLRATATLASLQLGAAGLCRDMDAAGALLGALVGHPSLRLLALTNERVTDPAALGAALAALVAADAPALQILNISDNALGDAGLAPLVAALPRNRHLRSLNISRNGMSEAFARERLLPAVRANTGLRALQSVDPRDVEEE